MELPLFRNVDDLDLNTLPTFNLELNNTPSSNSKQSNILNKTLAKTEDNLELEEEDNPKVLFYY